ncbi:hypothetical protein INT47_003039 [Mucor saturninus]|uniref:Heat shock protein 70 n=1 Tax=Mucor saturninus TaxID=64648 RepID=A0A8H7QTA2_9FUNG|nr:hypothetical protein INT47_003039 [Mucor saturninus]
MTSLNQIEYIVGIDLGIATSTVSIAHVNDPFNIITVLSWDDLKKSSQKFLSSVLYLKDGNDTPLCGIRHDDVGDLGVYVANIGQYLFDIDASNEKLGQMMDGLTLKKVISDYLKYFVQLALKRLQIHDKVIKNIHFKEFVNEEFIDEDIKTVCYCLVCPTNRQEFMKDCFIDAEIIEKSEAEHRLSFITKAVATAHYQLSLPRYMTRIQDDQNYLVCDLGDISIGLAKINAASTESLSVVTKIYDDLTLGSINLETNFKSHLMNNMADLNLDNLLIDLFVDKFLEIKYAFTLEDPDIVAISIENSNGDTVNFTITDIISNAEEANNQCDLFLSGKYGADTHFIESLTVKNAGVLTYHYHTIDDKLEKVSSGAVSSIISTYKSQIPFVLDNENRSLFPDKERLLPEKVLEESTDDNNGHDAYDFIVGIDFGTSFSGCSYVKLKDKDGNPVTEKTIKTISKKWPGNYQNKHTRAPTLLIYDKDMRPEYWGEEASLNATRHKDRKLLKNFKLFLCPESLEKSYGIANNLGNLEEQVGFADDGTPKNEVNVIRVIADYLRRFHHHAIKYILAEEMNEIYSFFNRTELLEKYKIRYVITIPAMWSSLARNSMVKAAIEATMIKEDEVNQLLIISDLEAAALSCEKRFTDYIVDSKRDVNNTNFIVCDAGGGTVDLVTFNLKVNEKKESMICQIGDGIGDTCGSTYLDVRFKDYIRDFYASLGVNIDIPKIQLDSVMQHFIKNQKTQFMPDLEGDSFYDISLPGKDVLNFSSSSKYRMADNNRTLKMKNQDMKEIVFDPIVKRIFDLIDNQLKQAKKGSRKIDAILMVGGFSQSRYLQQCIKDQYKGVCHVSVPFEGVTAISHGAVSYALNPRMILKRSAEQSFSLEVQAPFYKKLTDSAEKKVVGPVGVDYVRGRLEFFVTKNQQLEGDRRTVCTKDVFVQYPNAAVIAISSCDSKTVANNRYVTDSHAKIMETKITMPSVNKRDGDLVKFKVSLQIEHIGVSVTVECQDPHINEEVRKITKNQRSSLISTPKYSLNVANSKPSLALYSENASYMFNIRETS